MEGITTFNSKALMEAYINTTDTTSHVLEELLVYLLTAKLEYLFLVHGWYSISSNITLDPLAGANSLLKVAKLQVINLSTKELNTYIPTNALTLEPGIYRIDYGIYRNLDGSWSIENIILNPYIKFILIDSKVTKIGNAFPHTCDNLNGTLFTSLEDNSDILLDIDEQFITGTSGLVDLTLSKIESHIVNSTLYMFGNRCPNLGNLDFIDNNNIKTLVHIFRGCWTSNKSIIYANTKLSSANFRYLDKILEVVIPEENPNLVWDSNINSICKKTLYKGYKEIVTGGGLFPHNYLEIPSGYIIKDAYDAYAGRTIDIINLYNYDAIDKLTEYNKENAIWLTGFHDCGRTKTFILPKNITYIFNTEFNSAWTGFHNIIIPSTKAPIVRWCPLWGDWYGKMGQEYAYSFADGGDWFAGPAKDVPYQRNLYVLKGTLEDQNSWTEKYDRTTPEQTGKGKPRSDGTLSPGQWYNEETGQNERPNIWYDLILGDDSTIPLNRKRFCWHLPITYCTLEEMDTLVQELVQEQINNN